MNDSSAIYRAVNIPILMETTTLAHSAFTQVKNFDDWTGTVTVTNIPPGYVNNGEYITVSGWKSIDGKNSGLLWCGDSLDGNEITTLLINSSSMNVPIVFGRFTNQWGSVNVSVVITTQTKHSMNTGPTQTTAQKGFTNVSFGGSSGNRTATVNW